MTLHLCKAIGGRLLKISLKNRWFAPQLYITELRTYHALCKALHNVWYGRKTMGLEVVVVIVMVTQLFSGENATPHSGQAVKGNSSIRTSRRPPETTSRRRATSRFTQLSSW